MWFLLVLLYASSPHLSSTQEYRLILQDGDGPCEGYVKIFHNNKWGVVGDQKWHENNEKVICKSIGCGTSVRSKDIVLQKVWDITWMNEVECDGNEEYLWNCMFPGWNISSYTKDTLKLITCSDKIHLELESLPGYRCAGTLKYKKTSMEKVIETGYFIHPNWDKQQADLVCEHLKCGQSKGLPAAGTFSRKETLTNLKPIKCSSVEHQKHIWQCITKDDVGNGEPVAVICSDHHNFRLQGGDNVCSGELEVDDGGGLWKPVCQSQYKLNASNHDLCSHMRCGTNHVQERMVCDGSKNISLDCTDKVNTLLLDDQSQSVSHCFGSVHFNHSGRLEAVCSNDWDTKDGEVVCRELNCGEVVSVRSGSQTKDGMHDRVDCKGSEASLWHCLANHYENSTTCSKVNVICSGSVNVRLSDGPGKCAGRVEIQYDGVWKSVSASNWKVENSKVMCNELRCGDALDAPDSFIQGTSPVMNIEVTCATDSKSISYCIKPNKKLKQQQKKNKMLICQEHKVVFLVGGSACSGKVGIERAGKSYWLSASNDTWDHETATVVCQQMDCGNAISISFESTSTVLASGTTELWKYSYNCRSKEKSIFDCKRSERLSNHSIASVVCSGNKTVSLNTDGQGEGKCWGKVNVCLNGMCGGVCEDAWTENKSDMLCKALSCGSAINPLSYPPSAEDKITISSVHSTQQTTNINQCNMVKNVDGSSCQKNPAIVVCSESVEAKIIDHRERCSGNVKMFYQGNWHPVCKAALQNQDVQNTICRELGCGQAVKALSLFGPSPESSVAVVSNLTCNATSKSSSECRVNLTQTNQCPLGGLQCSEWRRMVLKLGKGACEGQVFVYSEGDSRAVSGNGWTKTEAKVLCADLGCGAYKKHSVGNADYNGLWWGKKYSCEGKTKSIWDCEKNDRPSQNQSLNVQCQDNFRTSLVNLGDPGKCFGQVTLNNLPVCYDNWDDSHNKIVCQEQECSNSVSFEETKKGSRNEGHFVSCVGSESNLGQCKTTRGKCSRGLVSVSCADRVKFNTTQKCGGMIEILYRDTWELVCQPDYNKYDLLCEVLGCGYFKENRGQNEITEEEKRERRRPEMSLKCSSDIKLQHCLVKNGCDNPGKIYCEDYSVKEPIVPMPINLYVGLSLGALSLVMVAALCLFLRRRFVTRFKSRFSMRKESTFESGDYEDVETNGHELLGPMEMRDLNHHGSESGGDKENGRRSATSSLSYDDIAEEENVPAQPLSSGGDGTSSPEHVTYEVEEDQQESYDDVVSMIPPAETREEIAEVHERPKPKGLEIHDGKDSDG